MKAGVCDKDMVCDHRKSSHFVLPRTRSQRKKSKKKSSFLFLGRQKRPLFQMLGYHIPPNSRSKSGFSHHLVMSQLSFPLSLSTDPWSIVSIQKWWGFRPPPSQMAPRDYATEIRREMFWPLGLMKMSLLRSKTGQWVTWPSFMKASSAISNSTGTKINSSLHLGIFAWPSTFLYHLFGAGQHRLFDIPMAAHLFYSNFIKQPKFVSDLAASILDPGSQSHHR